MAAMGVMKKAPLGSSASVSEYGSAVIVGDRNLLSHYDSERKQFDAPTFANRKLAILRRNLVAKGLAREYDEQKAREDTYKSQVPRHRRQQKLLENYHRKQEQHHEKTNQQSKTLENSDDNDNEDEFIENVVLVVPKRTTSAPIKPSVRSRSPIVPLRGPVKFSRHANLRQLRDNQTHAVALEKSADLPSSVAADVKLSTSEADLPKAASRSVHTDLPVRQDVGLKTDPQNLSKIAALAPWLSTANRSAKIVLRELGITKDVILREQLVRQLRQTLPVIDNLALDFCKCQNRHKLAQDILKAAKASPSFRMKKKNSLIGLTLTFPQGPEADHAQNAVVEAENTVTELNTRLLEFIDKFRYHMHHVEMLVSGVQQATLGVVDGILKWRQMRQQQRKLTNFQRLYRFPWKRQKITNYLLHIGGDLCDLFPSVALELLLGPKAIYNPLMLSQEVLQQVGSSSTGATGETFLTERACKKVAKTLHTPFERRSLGSREQVEKICIDFADLPRLREVLAKPDDATDLSYMSLTLTTQSADLNELRRCIEAIQEENELEDLERRRCGDEEQRIQGTHDPFSIIKSSGGVEETLSNIMNLQSPTSRLLGEQLRLRQEDTTRAANSAMQWSCDESHTSNKSAEVLHVNPVRLKHFLEERAALLEPVTDCELRDIQRWGLKSKLQGQIMVRKNNEKRVEHYLARKIQLQYLAHRQRNSIKTHLSQLICSVRVSVINIQRIFRGHRAKSDYDCMRKVWLEHHRQLAAVRTIINSFRRSRRRQRHRRSMTVESVAQAQLINILTHKLHDSAEAQEAAERYRRVGEERRRQRVVLLQKHKMEQQELERKRNIAAVRMQSVVRSHLAQGQAKVLRQEKKAHMTAVSAMAIQSTIRKFLDHQQVRRQRFRKDLERVNQSAVRIQSIYRGYNSRASLLGQLDEKTWQALSRGMMAPTFQEEKLDDEDDDESSSDKEDDKTDMADVVAENSSTAHSDSAYHLPPIISTSSRPSSSKSNLFGQERSPLLRRRVSPNPVSLPPLWVREESSSSLMSSTESSTGTGRRISMGMTRIELKLKEAEIGDKFDTPPSRRNSFVGHMRFQS